MALPVAMGEVGDGVATIVTVAVTVVVGVLVGESSSTIKSILVWPLVLIGRESHPPSIKKTLVIAISFF